MRLFFKMKYPWRAALLIAVWVALVTASAPAAEVTGELKLWHRVTLTFAGPQTSETATPNPFTDYRLDVTFRHEPSGRTLVVPGYYAADGDAANSGATSGAKWRVHFSPDATGRWSWNASFRTGPEIAMADAAGAGKSAGFCDGDKGELAIGKTDKTGDDFRAKGRLRYVGEHYLRFAGNNEWFLKVGPDSPEGFLANPDIDCEDPAGTRSLFSRHGQHWHAGDPQWRGGKGHNVIGAVNYIASQKMNCFYLLAYTGHGDVKSVWPFRTVDDRFHFDCSKLDQWEIIFAHMEAKGILNHFVFTETENESYWEVQDGEKFFGKSRKLYYRELIARFGHHLALVWNLGEEIGWTDKKGGKFGVATTPEQRRAFCDFIRKNDPYQSPIVAHTLPGPKNYEGVYGPLLGYKNYEGISGQFSLQPNGMSSAHDMIKAWIDRSEKAGRRWIVCDDEPGGENIPLKNDAKGERLDTAGVRPDSLDANHDYPRQWMLWGSLMAGAAGNETYFGWGYTPQGGGDGQVNNYAAWQNWWAQCRHAHDFFTQYLPFQAMHHADELVAGAKAFCFAKRGEVYAVYLREGGAAELDLTGVAGNFQVQWFDPRSGGGLQNGSVKEIAGGARRALGAAPSEPGKDWAILIRRNTK